MEDALTLVFIIVLIGLCFRFCKNENPRLIREKHERYMKECLADGKKRYECEFMIYR